MIVTDREVRVLRALFDSDPGPVMWTGPVPSAMVQLGAEGLVELADERGAYVLTELGRSYAADVLKIGA